MKKYVFWLLIVSIVLNGILLLKLLPKKNLKKVVKAGVQVKDNLFDKVNPSKGYEVNVIYGDLGPKMLASGVIDYEKFKAVYEKDGSPLSTEQNTILTKGSDNKIKVNSDNAYFLLNFFWAVGLANKSRILTDGDMVKYGQGEVGNFASTGGWSLAKSAAMNYYAGIELISLDKKQTDLVEKVSSNIYRPCCNNPTSFPDCNHGMALLGLLELMAAKGATENQMYEAGKYFNAFWFPGNYYDLALYFKNKEGKNFGQINSRLLLSREYSSASGWQSAKQWLAQKGLIKEPPKQNGGCGV